MLVDKCKNKIIHVKIWGKSYNLTDFYDYSISPILRCTFLPILTSLKSGCTLQLMACHGLIISIFSSIAVRKIMVHLIITGFLGSVVYGTTTATTTITTEAWSAGFWGLQGKVHRAERPYYLSSIAVVKSNSHRVTWNFPRTRRTPVSRHLWKLSRKQANVMWNKVWTGNQGERSSKPGSSSHFLDDPTQDLSTHLSSSYFLLDVTQACCTHATLWEEAIIPIL